MNPDNTGDFLFTYLKKELGSHLTSLGAQLKTMHDDQDLSSFFSAEAIDEAIIFPNPRFANNPEPTQGMVMPALQNLFDYANSPPESMPEEMYLHGVMMTSRLANASFQQRVLGVAVLFEITKEDKTFQDSLPKSYARCFGKMLSVEDHRFKSL